MVLLTATLPPSLEPELWRRMAWSDGQVRLFHALTTHSNIRYSVVDARGGGGGGRDGGSANDAVERLVRGEKRGNVVVFYTSRARVEAIAGRLGNGCGYFHGSLPLERRIDMLRRFKDGRLRVVVATRALGMGVDLLDIRVVVHANEPRDLIEYA
jgi:superfamily II DNA helicase RecQ